MTTKTYLLQCSVCNVRHHINKLQEPHIHTYDHIPKFIIWQSQMTGITLSQRTYNSVYPKRKRTPILPLTHYPLSYNPKTVISTVKVPIQDQVFS